MKVVAKTMMIGVKYMNMLFGSAFKYIISIVAKNKALIAVLLIAVFLRMYRLDEFVTFLSDQGRDAIIMKRIVTLEHFPAIGAPSSIGQIYLGPFFYYLMAPFLLIFNFNPVGLSYGLALLSILGMIITYIVTAKETNKNIALLLTVFIAFSAVSVAASRFAWNPNLLPIFSFLSIYFFYRMLTKKTTIDALLTGSFLSLSFQLHHLTIFVIAPLTIYYLVELFKSQKREGAISNGIYAIGAFVFFSIPLILFDLRHNFLNTKNLMTLLTEKNEVESKSLVIKVVETIHSFVSHSFQLSLPPFVSVVLFVLFIVTALCALKKEKSIFLKLNLIVLCSFLLLFSLLNSERHPHYYNPVYYSFYLLFTYLIFRYVKNIVFISIVCLTFGVLNLNNMFFFHNPGTNQIDHAKKIAQSIIEENPQEPFQIVASPSTETHGHVRYFLEIYGKRPLSEDSIEKPKELYIMCNDPNCPGIDDPQWQIASFQDKKIDKIVQSQGVTIFKIRHEK